MGYRGLRHHGGSHRPIDQPGLGAQHGGLANLQYQGLFREPTFDHNLQRSGSLTDSAPQVTITINSSNPSGLTKLVYWFSSQLETDAVPYTGPFVLSASNWNSYAAEAMKEVKIYTKAVSAQTFVLSSASKDTILKNQTSAFLAQLSKDPLREPEISPNAGDFDYTAFPIPVTLKHPIGQGGEIWYSLNKGA